MVKHMASSPLSSSAEQTHHAHAVSPPQRARGAGQSCAPSRLAMSTWGMIWGTASETVARASLTLTALKAWATAARGLWLAGPAAAAWLLACAQEECHCAGLCGAPA